MVKKAVLFILALVVIFEEWLWEILAFAGQRLSTLLRLEKFDEWLIQATPKQALMAFLIPLVIITPFNLLALFLLAHGAIIQGLLLEIVIKLLGTLLIARIFHLVKPALLTYGALNYLYQKITGLLNWARYLITNTNLYRFSLKIKASVKLKIAHIIQTLSK